jgi:hypothetical protein
MRVEEAARAVTVRFVNPEFASDQELPSSELLNTPLSVPANRRSPADRRAWTKRPESVGELQDAPLSLEANTPPPRVPASSIELCVTIARTFVVVKPLLQDAQCDPPSVEM